LYSVDKPDVASVPTIQDATAEKRRWGLAMLVMVIAAGAAAARAARRR
jgi:hypothetical protein